MTVGWPSTLTTPSFVSKVALAPRLKSASVEAMSRYGARPLDGATSLHRTASLLQPRAQASLTSAVPSWAQRTRLPPSQRSAWLGAQTWLGVGSIPPSSDPTAAGGGNPHPASTATHTTLRNRIDLTSERQPMQT